jgi:hypothetical protein
MIYKTYDEREGQEVQDTQVAVKVTAHQESALYDELAAKRDAGALRYALRGERRIVGTIEQLGEVAYHLENSLAVARATGQGRRLRMLSGVLMRLAAAGVSSQVRVAQLKVSVDAGTGASLIPVVPEAQPFAAIKQVHPSKLNRVWFTVEQLPRRTARGRGACKKAWSSKAKQRDDGSRGMIRGDRVFWHDEYKVEDGIVTVTSEPNDWRGEWLSAGDDPAVNRRIGERARSKQLEVAIERSRQPIELRVTRAVEVARRKHGRATVGVVLTELLREDLRAHRYQRDDAKYKSARERYRRSVEIRAQAGWKVTARRYEVPTVEAQAKAAKRGRNLVPVSGVCNGADHAWRVSPKRTRRTCEVCGKVHVKFNGRWSPRRAA